MSTIHERSFGDVLDSTTRLCERSCLWRLPLLSSSVAVLAAFLSMPARGDSSPGIGVLGDSYSDEYEFYPPDRSRARNWVEILARARGLNFGLFSGASRGAPRNQGFAYNWAQSDAETSDLVRVGQHTGLSQQVARGEVVVVVVFIGGNDFIHGLGSQGQGRDAGQILREAIANLDLAVRSILEASPTVQVLIATLPDIFDLPEFAASIRSGRLSSGVAAPYCDAISRYNRHIRLLPLADRRIALLDLALAAKLAPRPDGGHVVVAGRRLDRTHPANDLDHVFLADSRHLGTLAQGVLANCVISALNARFDARIKPLTLVEILDQDPGASNLALSGSSAVPVRPAVFPLPVGAEAAGK
jgi:hypothetical protein